MVYRFWQRRANPLDAATGAVEMIDGIEITITCDRMPVCKPIKITQDGPEVDYDLLAQSLALYEWIERNGDHICPACRYEYEAEMRLNEPDAAHESRLMDRDNRIAVNAGRY
jgi:hypothetical protein